MTQMTMDELTERMTALGAISDEQKREIVCTLIGHSKIMTTCFGYWYCGRCNTQLGDTLGGSFDGRGKIIIGHDCDLCRKNYETVTWRDTYLVADPFAKATP